MYFSQQDWLMDFHSAQNIPLQPEIELRNSQNNNDDICLPICLLFLLWDELIDFLVHLYCGVLEI